MLEFTKNKLSGKIFKQEIIAKLDKSEKRAKDLILLNFRIGRTLYNSF